MIGKEVRGVRPVSLSEVLEILEERKRAGPLGYEQQSTYDYAAMFNKLDAKTAKKLIEMLVNDYNISENVAVNIVDVVPEYVSTLRTILARDKLNLSEAKMKEIIRLLQENVKKPEKKVEETVKKESEKKPEKTTNGLEEKKKEKKERKKGKKREKKKQEKEESKE